MCKSSSLRFNEYREIHQLVGECRELGDDVAGWHRHLIEHLLRLTGGSIGFVGELTGFRSMRPSYIGMSDWGWENDSDRSCYFANHVEFVKDPKSYATMIAYHRRMVINDGICLSRTELFDDRNWYSTNDYTMILCPVGVDNVLWCLRALPGVLADESSGINLMRSRGRRDFGARDRAIVQETHAAIVPLVGGSLARFADPAPTDLAPQVRRVLRCLLEGDGDKQIAVRMKLSTHTVNQYTKVIFRHFGVRGRTELMARWIRRGWSSRYGAP